MSNAAKATLEAAQLAAHAFAIEGELQEITHVKTGHINETFRTIWRNTKDRAPRSFIHQCMNQHVFPDVPRVLENVRLVTEYLRPRLAQCGQSEQTLEIIAAKDGTPYWRDAEGQFWRTFLFVEGAESFDVCPGLPHAQAVGAAFGRFLALLKDFDKKLLVDPIANFQNVALRLTQLESAIQENPVQRVREALDVIQFVREQRALAHIILEEVAAGNIPLRVTHADPKVNNVLFANGTTTVRCVVDLDTCMVGTSLYDFGDMVRSAGVPVAEDEPDLEKVEVDPDLFGALTEGYLQEAHTVLTPREIELMAVAPGVIGFSLGMRFLADHLLGDRYFRVHYAGQNLARARTQLAIAASVVKKRATLMDRVQECLKKVRNGPRQASPLSLRTANGA